MSDTVRVSARCDVAKRPSVTVEPILYVREDGGVALIPAGTEIDLPDVRNVNVTSPRVGIAAGIACIRGAGQGATFFADEDGA